MEDDKNSIIVILSSDEEKEKSSERKKEVEEEIILEQKIFENEPKKKKFHRRNSYYLRVGERIVLPVLIFLHDPSSFSEIHFLELISTLKELLPSHFGSLEDGTLFTTKYLDSNQLLHHSVGSLKFTYQFRPLSRARCCILTKKNSLTTNPSVVQSEDSFSEGEEEEKDGIPKQSFKPHSEKYEGFTITKYTLIIEALAIDQDKDSSLSSSLKYRPILTDPNLTNKKTKVISRYFIPENRDSTNNSKKQKTNCGKAKKF